jgi:hypothetical protein
MLSNYRGGRWCGLLLAETLFGCWMLVVFPCEKKRKCPKIGMGIGMGIGIGIGIGNGRSGYINISVVD